MGMFDEAAEKVTRQLGMDLRDYKRGPEGGEGDTDRTFKVVEDWTDAPEYDDGRIVLQYDMMWRRTASGALIEVLELSRKDGVD